MIGIDFETTALTPGEGRVRLIQIADGARTYIADCDHVDSKGLLLYALTDNLVAHNANFEELWLWHAFQMSPRQLMDDTMVMTNFAERRLEEVQSPLSGTRVLSQKRSFLR